MGVRSSSRGKLLHLQGLRGVAILSVTLFHFFPSQFKNGYLGVDLFFALSGYLMAMMLSKYPKLGPSEIVDFLYRRVKRIVPLYYLFTLITLVTLHFLPFDILRANIRSSTTALEFATNLIRPDSEEDYFNKLSEGADMFTHTWSLSLEMQFYLLFPFIFIVYRMLPDQIGKLFLGIVSKLSFLFYVGSDSFMSFNSMFARIWQFNAGMFVYIFIVPLASKEEEHLPTPLLSPISEPRKNTFLGMEVNHTTYILFGLVALLLSSNPIPADFARVLLILLTMHLFQFGANTFLENKVLVFMGEVSYGWYLIHWPFAACCRLYGITNLIDIFLIFALTCIMSVAVHYLFEKQYLQWDSKLICAFVAVMMVLNVRELYSLRGTLEKSGSITLVKGTSSLNVSPALPNKFYYFSDFNLKMDFEWSNKTKQELQKLNQAHQATDIDRVMLKKLCPKWKKTNFTSERRCVYEKDLKADSNLTGLVIGNSYAGNVMPVIYDECKGNFSRLEISFRSSCESLVRTDKDCTGDEMFLAAVQELQPDVLFIVERHLKFLEIVGGGTPFDDKIFKEISSRLTELEKFVKRRIYILEDFPQHVRAMRSADSAILTRTRPDDKNLGVQGWPNVIGRMRLQRLASECPKCRLFDYTPQFFANGTFKFYHPTHFMSFVTTGRHLTPPGLERVRPLVRHLCQSF